MALLFVLILLVLALLLAAVFVLGFGLGGAHWQRELAKVRRTAGRAERELYDTTINAFEAMADRAEEFWWRKP